MHGLASEDLGQVARLLLRRAVHDEGIGLHGRAEARRRLGPLHDLQERQLLHRTALLAAKASAKSRKSAEDKVGSPEPTKIKSPATRPPASTPTSARTRVTKRSSGPNTSNAAAVVITFNGSEFRCLFPENMAIFYMYSLKRGVAVKPWFMPDEAQ